MNWKLKRKREKGKNYKKKKKDEMERRGMEWKRKIKKKL